MQQEWAISEISSKIFWAKNRNFDRVVEIQETGKMIQTKKNHKWNLKMENILGICFII